MEDNMDIPALDRKFGISGIAAVVAGHGGMPKVEITTDSGSAEVYLHGAHVTSWNPTNLGEVFFVSSGSRWQDGSAIRGGVPICFPWFGDKVRNPKAPPHGFVRSKSWQLKSIQQSADGVSVNLRTGSDDTTKRWWDADFELNYRVTVGLHLKLELELLNTGLEPLRFEEALHAYFRVGDVRSCTLTGLDSVRYLDKTDSYREKQQEGALQLSNETDRVYLDTDTGIELIDPNLPRRICIAKENSRTTVVWNPWATKAAAMSDLPGDEWTCLFCVETSNVLGYAVELRPSQRHCMNALIEVHSS
jgi:D-hexose-6-phosphate mutarotase